MYYLHFIMVMLNIVSFRPIVVLSKADCGAGDAIRQKSSVCLTVTATAAPGQFSEHEEVVRNDPMRWIVGGRCKQSRTERPGD